MRKLSQLELLNEGFLDTIRTAGKAVKAVGKGIGAVAKGIHALDPEGFNAIAAPITALAKPVIGVAKGIAAITPTTYLTHGIKGWFMFAKDFFSNQVKTTYKNAFEPGSITDIKLGIDRGRGQTAIPAQDAIKSEAEVEARDEVKAKPASLIIDPSTGKPATPAIEAQPAIEGKPAVEGRPATDAIEATVGPLAKGRTIINFKAKRYGAVRPGFTGGSSDTPEDFTAILVRDKYSADLKLMDPKAGYTMTIYDKGGNEVRGTKAEAVPSFDKIYNTFLKKSKITVAPDSLTPEQAKEILSIVYMFNHKIFDTNKEKEYKQILQQPKIVPATLKNELIKQKLVEKVNSSQKVLLEQLKNL